MTFHERYMETLLFGVPGKIPLLPGWPRESTLKVWYQQGFPEGKDFNQAMLEDLGLPPMAIEMDGPGVFFGLLPFFEEKVLEHKDGHYIVQDWMGAITEISDEFDFTYIRSARDFVTRKWHRFPVQTRDDWERMKERYDLDTPERFRDFTEKCETLKKSGAVMTQQVNGPFWQLREWCGFENLCMLFIEDPDFVRDMIAFWTEFVSRMLARIHERISLDRFGISEDMAYKAHSMISPKMAREFLMPTYERWVSEVKAAGCRIVDMDSDGYIGELIPIWIDAGINACSPMEVAAHNDIAVYREQFGRKMAFSGGVDKRAIARGGKVIEAEVARATPVIRSGGYLPGCDHAVPWDVSWPNYLYYSRLLAKTCGWL